MEIDRTDPIAALNAALTGRYRIDEEVGSGGMARVYRAEDLRHHRPVALKVLRQDVAAAVGVERFLREIEIAAALQHPHILPLLDSGEAGGRAFYVMPYVEGESLRERLGREGELPVPEAVRLLVQITDAVAYAHEHGVVHRDIKPDNVMLTGRHALVTDFGVARALAADDVADGITTAGRAVGTPAYMAPEQAVADPHVDHRADIYAVGVLAYELLTGHTPFAGRSHRAMLAAQLTASPNPLSEDRPAVPEELEDVVLRCLARRPADRWQSADEVRSRLEPLVTPGTGSTPLGQPSPRLPRSGRRGRWAAGIGVVTVAVVLLGWGLIGGWFGMGGDERLELGHAERLTTETGLEIHPTISPDGSLVAYAAGAETDMRIYIRPVSGGRTITLTEGSTAQEFAPRWSPDGSRILFLAPNGAYLAAALGGAAQRVAGPAEAAGSLSSFSGGLEDVALSGAAWSPDGNRIFLARGGELSILDLASMAEEPLTTLNSELYSCDWSPRGDWVACASGNWSAIVPGTAFGNIAPSSVVLVSVTTGEVREITDRASLNESPAWSPDGRRLYFVSSRRGPRDIYVVGVGADGRLRGEPDRVTAGLDAQSIDFSGDGRRVVYASYASRANVWTVPIPSAGAPVSAGTATRLTSENQIVEALRATRDGQWLYYDSNLRGNADIYRMPADGGTAQQLTTHATDDFAPDVSPDGRWIAYHSWRTGSRDIFVQPVAGGPAQQLTDSPSQESYPIWSPDGDAIVYYDQWDEGGESRGLFILRRVAAGAWGDPEPLRRGTSEPAWSPDGRFLAYARGLAIEVLPLDSGTPRVVYDAGPGDPAAERVEVSDDGRTLYFKSHDDEGHATIWAIPTTGGTPRPLVRFDDPGRPSIRSDFAAAAGRFFFTLEDRQSDIWVAEMIDR